MKLQVVRCDGDTETLDLVGTLHAIDPIPAGQGALLVDASGVTHFFRAEDGAYDGWGMEVGGDLNEVDVHAFVEAVERDRMIHHRTEAK